MRNVEDKLPKSQLEAVHDAMTEIMYLENEAEARRKWERLAKSLERAYPKAAKCMRDDVERLFAYYQFPASTWYHLRTTNAIESIFAPIRHRTDAMKRLRTGRFATAVVLALIGKLSRKWRRSARLPRHLRNRSHKDDFDACCIEARSMRYFAHAITPP